MTIYQAIESNLYPYVLPESSIQLNAINAGLNETLLESPYEPENHAREVAKAVIGCLWQLISLEEESDGGSRQKYDVDKMKDRIRRLSRKFDIVDETEASPQNEDITNWW